MWFNPLFNKNVSTNAAKRFLNLIDKQFSKDNKLHKFFNGSSVKVIYSCTGNIKLVITTHNKKLLPLNINTVPPCNSRINNKCPLNGKCRTRSILYKCVASTSIKLDKVYLGLLKEILNNVSFTIKIFSTTVLMVMSHSIKKIIDQ